MNGERPENINEETLHVDEDDTGIITEEDG